MKIGKIHQKLMLGILVLALLVPILQAEAAVLPLINPSFEQQGATRAEAYGWHAFNNGYRRTTGAHTGSWRIQATNSNFTSFAGAYQRIDLNQTEIKPVLIEGYVRGSGITNSAGGYFGAGLYAEIVLNDGTVAYWNSLPNYGSFNWRWIGFNTGVLPHVNKPISHIFIVPMLGLARGTAYFDDVKVTEFETNNHAVTFILDDGEENAYSQGKPVLDSHGFDATLAVPSGVVNTSGYLTQAQLLEVQNQGWEIMSHSITHSDLTQMSLSQATRELSNSKSSLERMGLNIKNFAFPFGAYNADLIDRGRQNYRSLRVYELGDNPQGVFTPHEPKVRSVVSSTSLAEVQGWLTEAKVNGRWVILAFHSISETGDDVYHTTPQMFSDIADLVAASGMPVVTYDKGLDLFGAPESNSNTSSAANSIDDLVTTIENRLQSLLDRF